MIREFTATVYIFHEQKVLLHPHKKLGKWLPPGGHLEQNEIPEEAAKREVLEETGLEIEFISDEHFSLNAYNAVSMERPFLMLKENIPAYKNQPVHEHMDFIYIARPKQIQEVLSPFQWITYEELQSIEVFPDTAKVLHYLLKEDHLSQIEDRLYQRR